MSDKPCSCHSNGSLYGQLDRCPACGHRSFDPWAKMCERRKCGYVEIGLRPVLDPAGNEVVG